MPHLRLLAAPAAHEWLARHRLAVSEQGPFLELALPARTTELDRELCAIGADWAWLDQDIAPSWRAFRLFVTDMDSTLIAIECIDEIADLAGLKPEVARITEAAMQGELDFREALNARVALLAGIPVARLEELYRERVRLNPGAARLVAALKENGCHCVLVSGGFTFFTERLASELGFDEAHANVLEAKDGLLTGRLVGPVIDAAAKAGILRTAAQRLGAARREILAAGDGANDLAMLALAGTRLAWRPKPRILPHVNVVSMAQGLDAVLELLP